MKNEGDVKKAVKKILHDYLEAGLWYFMPPANGYGRSGIPDFVGCVKGKFFAIETKFGANDLTANQLREIGAIKYCDGEVWVVREVNLSEFEAEFRAWASLCL